MKRPWFYYLFIYLFFPIFFSWSTDLVLSYSKDLLFLDILTCTWSDQAKIDDLVPLSLMARSAISINASAQKVVVDNGISLPYYHQIAVLLSQVKTLILLCFAMELVNLGVLIFDLGFCWFLVDFCVVLGRIVGLIFFLSNFYQFRSLRILWSAICSITCE